jgi:hypothetical protein
MDDNAIAQAMLDDLAAGRAVPPAVEAASSSDPTPFRQRKPRSDAGVPRGPRSVGIDPAGVDAALPRRTRRTAGRVPQAEPLKKEDISRLLTGAHSAAGAILGPKAKITKEQADEIAGAFVPVAEDFGIAVASKIVHIILLVAVVASVEGPVAWDVLTDIRAKQQAARARNVTNVVAMPQPVNGQRTETNVEGTAGRISQFGTEIGTPLTG